MKDLKDEQTKLDRLEDLIKNLRRFQPEIEKALAFADNSHSFDDIAERVLLNSLDMYVLDNSILLCETSVYPNHKAYHVYLGGGDLEEMLDAQDMIEREARLRDCKYVSMTGRLGWKPHFETRGWKHSLSIYKKEL